MLKHNTDMPVRNGVDVVLWIQDLPVCSYDTILMFYQSDRIDMSLGFSSKSSSSSVVCICMNDGCLCSLGALRAGLHLYKLAGSEEQCGSV